MKLSTGVAEDDGREVKLSGQSCQLVGLHAGQNNDINFASKTKVFHYCPG